MTEEALAKSPKRCPDTAQGIQIQQAALVQPAAAEFYNEKWLVY